jgi:prepilin signal peptidase PulO-like enzyme (type II secretory pathway)
MSLPFTPENEHAHQQQATPNYGYELLAFTTALLLVVFIGLIPTLIDAKLKQLPFCLVGLAFVLGALLAYHHQHHARFWAFIVAAVLITTGF